MKIRTLQKRAEKIQGNLAKQADTIKDNDMLKMHLANIVYDIVQLNSDLDKIADLEERIEQETGEELEKHYKDDTNSSELDNMLGGMLYAHIKIARDNDAQ